MRRPRPSNTFTRLQSQIGTGMRPMSSLVSHFYLQLMFEGIYFRHAFTMMFLVNRIILTVGLVKSTTVGVDVL
jgi:hypothetical protein